MQSLYSTPCYNVVLDIALSYCGSQILIAMEFYKEIIGKRPHSGHFPIIPM